MARKITESTAADVRAWGNEHGFPSAGRGRLSHELIAHYNAVTNTARGGRLPFVQTTAPEPTTVTVEVKRVNKIGRKMKPVTEQTTHGAIREWARGAGLDVPERGRVPQYLVDAYSVRNLAVAQ